MTGLRIVFAGTPDFGLPCLDALHASPHQLIALYTQADRPAGRGQKLQHSAIKTWGLAQNIPVYQPLHFKSEEAINQLSALKPDLLIVIAYGLILPKSVLSIPRFGCINVHASLLPRWRGASPIQQAILAGDRQTGITIMQMDVGMDTGDALHSGACEITLSDTTTTLQQRLSLLAPSLLLNSITDVVQGNSKPIPQDSRAATYAPKIKKQDAAIQWHQTAAQIDCQIRAYHPWPVAYTHASDLTLRIHKACVVAHNSHHTPGTILNMNTKGILVHTGQDALLIQSIQCPGGRPMTVAEYLNAPQRHLAVNTVLQ